MTNKKTIVTSATLGALCALGLAGCGTSAEEAVDSISEAAFGQVSANITGSDTLFEAMVDTFVAGGANCNDLVYVGTGSGNGEKCLRDSGCLSAPNHQNFAPMSRGLSGGATGPSEVETKIGLDGVGVWANTNTPPASIAITGATPSLRGTFCASPAGSCANSPEGGKVYRRDDASGTSDVFSALVGCTGGIAGLCKAGANSGKVCEVKEFPGQKPTINCTTNTATGTVTSPDCNAVGMSATECIGRLIANDPTAIGYAGAGATAGASGRITAIPVSTSGGTAITFTEANIRKLITDPANKYPLSRFLFLNTNSSRRPAEGNAVGASNAAKDNNACYNWMVAGGATGGADDLETQLKANGFFVCNTSATLDCTP